MQKNLKRELYDVISGKSEVRFGRIIQTIAGYLGDGTETSSEIKEAKQVREQETKRLISFISDNQLWLPLIDFSNYVSEGAEQRVYLKDAENVLTRNDLLYFIDTVFYLKDEFWVED